MADEDLHIETDLLHGAYTAEEMTGSTVPPLFQTTSFARKSAEELESVFAGRSAGYVYTRINNPTLSTRHSSMPTEYKKRRRKNEGTD